MHLSPSGPAGKGKSLEEAEGVGEGEEVVEEAKR
jgi:hypothetical protein